MLASTAALGVIAFYRARWRRAAVLERMRMQIATDLHDELGAGLSQMAMISEVALLAPQDDERSRALARIAKVSRDLLDSAGDLVWAIRPHTDRVSDLVERMREFGAEALTLLNIRFEFNVSPSAVGLKLDPEQRRQVFAVFKESINNVVRHSGCTRVRVELGREDGHLVLTTSDDGKGLLAAAEPAAPGHHGIAGMKWRARILGGALEIDSPSSNGLRVTLRVPLAAGRRGRTPA
jgi:signal transduction histidine kinase